jgi:hypothetical protein
MSSVFNQFSAVLLYIILTLVILSLLLWRIPPAKRRLALLVGLGVVVVAGLLIFRPVPKGVTAATVSELMAGGSGKPVLVELYSDY